MIRSSLFVLCMISFSCAGARYRPVPCLSDRECVQGRICHEGRCRFLDEVRAELAAKGIPSENAAPGSVLSSDRTKGMEAVMFMGGPLRNGRSKYPGPTREPRVIWVYRTQGRIFAAPLLGGNGTLFVGSLDKNLSALRGDGSLLWRYSGGDRFYSTPALGRDGVLFSGCDDKTLVALAAASGKVQWK